MAIESGVASLEALATYITQAGEFASVMDAVNAGVISELGYGIFIITEGGAGTAISAPLQTALEVAAGGGLAASGTRIGTAGLTLARTANGYSLVPMATMSLPAAAAAAAPFFGVALGANLYDANPTLWTKISQALLPFCYPGTDQIPTWAELVQSTGAWKMLMQLDIVDAIKQLFEDEGVHADTRLQINSPYGSVQLGQTADTVPWPLVPEYPFHKTSGNGYAVATVENGTAYAYCTEATYYRSDYYGGTFTSIGSGWSSWLVSDLTMTGIVTTWVSMTREELARIINNKTSESDVEPTAGIEPWSGAPAPAIPQVTPIIVVPEPLDPDYQPITEPAIPVTPPAVVPALPPHTDPIPLPAPPDPETDPEVEPITIPFPWSPPETSPDPEKWPLYIPWPLPEEPPDQWPTYPEVPKEWPVEFPSTEPWPASPADWPVEVPWPDHPPTDWPAEVPWPASPEDWPIEVPWPVPWPNDWPIGVPWPPPWPEEIPYPIPWPWPTPTPTPDPGDEPGKITDPYKQIQPYIDPIPWPYADPTPAPKPVIPTQPPSYPDPYDDPSQPDPPVTPRTDPDPSQPPAPPPSGEVGPSPGPVIPLPFSSATGLITVYHPNQATLLAFCNWLWVTWGDATIDKIWNNPFDGVITLFELYCTPTDVGTKTIRSGFLDSGISCPVISRYTEINCGSLGIPEYYGNYLDYSPYSKAYIYLPFIGVVELNVDDIVGHGVNVTYRIDEYNGSCIAMITVAKVTKVNDEDVEYSNVFYQYSGNCAVELPIAGGSQAAIKAGMLEAAAWGLGSVVGGIMSGSSLKEIASGMASGAANAVHSLVSAKSSVQHSGSFGSSYGAMGIKKPFITIVRPKQLQIANYNELYGYQAHRAVNIGECTGYLRCREAHVLSATASDEEKARIEELLKTGVYVTP